MNRKESKVRYREGGDIRALRGSILGEDDVFVVLQRRDGNIRVNKRNIIKIEGEYYEKTEG
jgi:hypothetical protein